VKDHPVTLTPDCLDHLISAGELEDFLHLGAALKDKSSIGKMRDCYALQFFTMKNCLKCLEQKHLSEFMYMLPFTLQEQVIRNPDLPRDDRLAKAVLSFKLLVHYFELSWVKADPRVSQRYRSGSTEAVTFAENSDWPRLLNTSLAIIQFIVDGDENWSFSRLGSHCLENFFGSIRQAAKGDDRMVRAMHIIAKTALVCVVMNDLQLNIKHRGRDNVGGVVIGGDRHEFQEPGYMDRILEQAIALSCLSYCNRVTRSFYDAPMQGMPLAELTGWVAEWAHDDEHHRNDPKCRGRRSPDNSRILPRVQSSQNGR
jgi:hypothetical protein